MSRNRARTGLLVTLLTSLVTALCLVGFAFSPAVAAPGETIIRGVVTDASGHHLDDVDVQAIDASGEVAASALTYASMKDSGPQHGFYGLYVEPGTYQLRYAKTGYRTGQYAERVTVTAGEILQLDPVALQVPPVRSTTRAQLVDRRITLRQVGKVKVTVSTAATSAPTGEVKVRKGGRVVGSKALRRGDRGSVTVRLDHLRRGTHRLVAHYRGSSNPAVRESSDTVRLTVTRPGRGRTMAYLPSIW